ncbi:MAG: hypothetical protein Q9193_000104 [Seirophora villosa]
MTLTPDGKRAIAVIWVLTPLSTIFLVLRLARKREHIGIDDWLLGSAVLLLYGLAITGTLSLIKFSVLFSYNAIFGRLRWFRYAVFTLGALTAAWFIGTFFSTIFQCTPIDKAWKPSKPGHCVPLKPYLYGNSVPNAIIDFCILLLPVAPVIRLQMATVQKVLVLSSFSLGSLASVSSTIRAAQTRTVDITNLSGSSASMLHPPITTDKRSASIFEASIWTYVEPNTGVMSACLPFLAHVFGKRLVDAFKSFSALMGRTTSRLGLLRRTDNSPSKTDIVKPGTQRAAYEAYDLSDNAQKGLPAYRNEGASQESVRNLV